MKEQSKREQRRKERQKIYQDKRWKTLRSIKIQEQPLCEMCLKDGKTVPATEIHHIKSFCAKGISEDEKIRRAFDYDNLMSLCTDCHIKMHHKNELTMKEKIKKYS